MSSTQLAEAFIENLETKDKIKCLFRPKEYTFTKTNSWPKDQKGGKNTPAINFGGGQPATLQMELLFDTYADGKDVRDEYVNKLWALMYVDEKKAKKEKNKKARPPKVKFHWGKAWTFEAVITSLSVKFTLFLPDGTPVRATATVSFQQVEDTKDLPKQNPTSGGVGGERVWTVTDGDRLDWVAYQELGDTAAWRRIAEANRMGQVRQLVPGTILLIPNG
jgi:nucleoid-associated protein YgaU